MVRRIVEGLRIDAKSGGNSVSLPASPGGSRVKRVLYVIKRVDASASTDDLTLQVQHSPDGNLWAEHTAAPALADIGDLLLFEASSSVILGGVLPRGDHHGLEHDAVVRGRRVRSHPAVLRRRR